MGHHAGACIDNAGIKVVSIQISGSACRCMYLHSGSWVTRQVPKWSAFRFLGERFLGHQAGPKVVTIQVSGRSQSGQHSGFWVSRQVHVLACRFLGYQVGLKVVSMQVHVWACRFLGHQVGLKVVSRQISGSPGMSLSGQQADFWVTR